MEIGMQLWLVRTKEHDKGSKLKEYQYIIKLKEYIRNLFYFFTKYIRNLWIHIYVDFCEKKYCTNLC
jgi:hypothetical protein